MDNLPKQDLRKEMLEKRSSLTAEYKKEAAEKIAAYIADVINTKNADRVLVLSFAAYNNEPDTELICDIITDMCEYSIDFAYPKVSDNNEDMEFYLSDYTELVVGYKGIREPDSENAEHIDAPLIAEEYDYILILLPGLAFDKRGYRAGYGGGFYDRFLARAKDLDCDSIGICYDFQYLPEDNICTDEYDMACDYIVTDERIVKGEIL
ncbi:MAG: 5-formyltetrahydrofolate cyclo-ligase [Lachnospiraceae bacterium]|nr:5-formyltetrahydrofolate cyclo-ligase [Lachnospiraceae bacterium]